MAKFDIKKFNAAVMSGTYTPKVSIPTNVGNASKAKGKVGVASMKAKASSITGGGKGLRVRPTPTPAKVPAVLKPYGNLIEGKTEAEKWAPVPKKRKTTSRITRGGKGLRV